MNFKFIKLGDVSSEQLLELVDLVNNVYSKAERGFWVEGNVRIVIEDMTDIINNEELLVCINLNKIVGCIRYTRVSNDVGMFGMLAVDPKFRGLNIGKKFIELIEEKAKSDELKKVHFELVDSIETAHPQKQFLRNWYSNQNYTLLSELDFKDNYSWLIQQTIVNLKLELWEKAI